MFTILANRRSGSHLLATLLDSHPDLTMYDEVVNDKAVKVLPDKKFEELGENEGCIILYQQFLKLAPERQKKVLNNKIIHLKRDIEDQARSYWVMRNMNLPVHTTEKVRYPNINDDYKKYIAIVKQLQNTIDTMSIPALNITYEWLTNNEDTSCLPREKAWTLTNYLGVPAQDLTTNLKKLCS